MLTPLTQEHLDLAAKAKAYTHIPELGKHLYPEREAIANFLADQFQAEDKNFDRANWLKACGL